MKTLAVQDRDLMAPSRTVVEVRDDESTWSKNVWSEDHGDDRVGNGGEEARDPWWNDRGSDAAWKELQQVVMHDDGRRQSWSTDSVNEKLVETDDGARRSSWREWQRCSVER